MRQVSVTAGPYAAASATRFVNTVIPTSGTALTLATTTVDAVQRRVLVTYGVEAADRTLVLIGTNAAGNPITETITIPNGGAGTAISVLDYLTLTSATPAGGGWTAAMSLGTIASTTSGSSPWVRMDEYALAQTEVQFDVTGTVNYTLETSDDDPNLVPPQVPTAVASMTWLADGTVVSKTASMRAGLAVCPLWARVTVNSYSGTGKVGMKIFQVGFPPG